MPFILALDQGTTSSRAIVFTHDGAIVAMAQREFTQYFPKAGWVEHDAMEIWDSQLTVAREAIAGAKLSASDITAIGLTNQRETVVLWERATGNPIGRAIVWQDRRTADYCNQLKRDGYEKQVADTTGLVIDAYFSASKIRWMLDHIPDARRRAEAGELAVGTIDSWLLWNLTGATANSGGTANATANTGAVHATDVTNASRTLLYNLHTGQWDQPLLDLFRIPAKLLPTIRPCSFDFGQSAPALFGKSIPITGIAGDQQAALFGQTCFTRGLAKNTYGTGCFLLTNVGDQPAVSKHQLLSTVAWKINERTKFALEGSVFIGGAVVQWLRDGLGIIDRASDVQALAQSVPDSGGIYMVPAFVGLGAPHWDQHARGAIIGITRGTTKAHFARAALESIAFQVADVLDVMHEDSNISLKELRVDGAAAANDLLLQFQADLLRLPVVRPRVTETTALGAAYLAGLHVGYWKDENDIASNWQVDRTFEPTMGEDEATHRRSRWSAALERSKNWEETEGTM